MRGFFSANYANANYFLANCAPKIPNYEQIMQIAQYFLAKNWTLFVTKQWLFAALQAATVLVAMAGK